MTRGRLRAMLGVGASAWLLGACVSAPILGLALPKETTLEVERARFDVEALAVDGSVMFVSGEHTDGKVVPGLAELLPSRPTFACDVGDAEIARRLVRLIEEEALGPIESCDIDLTWTRDHGTDRLVGHIRVIGSSAELAQRCSVDAEQLRSLLALPAAVPACDVDDPRLAQVIAVAEQMSWRALDSWAVDDEGRVLACLRPETGSNEDVSLVVQIGAASSGRFVVVPADLVPLLAEVRRETTSLFQRFSFTAPLGDGKPCPIHPAATPLRVPSAAELGLTTRERGRRYRLDSWLLDNLVVAPGGVMADAFVWFMQRGPWGHLFTPERPPKIPEWILRRG